MAELQLRNREREKRIQKLYENGYTYKEIAEQLDITRARVGQIYRRMLREKSMMNRYTRVVNE